MTPSEKLSLRAVTFDSPYLIQIMNCDGEVIITVGSPQNTTDISHFCIWNGYGVDENGVETTPDFTVKVRKSPVDVVWKRSVGMAYLRAIGILLRDNG